MIKSAVLLLCVACLLASVTCQWGPPRPRCPRGHVSGRRCSGWDPNSCPPGSFCHAPADAGYCCRRRGSGGGYPPSRY